MALNQVKIYSKLPRSHHGILDMETRSLGSLVSWAPVSLVGNASHLCLFGPIWAPHVRTPYLVHEEQFDHFLLGKRWGGVVTTPGKIHILNPPSHGGLVQMIFLFKWLGDF